jgi:hypothetical protein
VQYIVAKALCYQPWPGNTLWPKTALLAKMAWLGGFAIFFAKYYFGRMLPAMHTLNTQSFELSWKSRHGSTQGLWHDGLTTTQTPGQTKQAHKKNIQHSCIV